MIRFGTRDDVKQVNVIRKQVAVIHQMGEPQIFKGFTKGLEEHIYEFFGNLDKKLLVYEADGEILGYAMLEFVIKPETDYRYALKYLDVCELGVLQSRRSQGIGKKLLDEIQQVAKNNGYYQIQLNAWTFNERGLKFYNDYGFQNYRDYFRLDI